MKGRKPHLDTSPTTTPPPEPPSWLTGHARDAWIVLAADLHARGILHALDTGSLATYCTVWATFRQAQEELEGQPVTITTKQGLVVNPAIRARDAAVVLLNRLAGELGLSPVSRKRLAKDAADESPNLFLHEAERRARGA